jgi:arylsulfatase A-like enzyme
MSIHPIIATMRGIACVSLIFLHAFPASAETPASKPNILVIVADDLGYADTGFQGCKDIPTPALDALAARGIRCTSGYSGHPYCSPTRAGFMTGRYQQRFGHENNPRWEPENDKVGLPLSETTLPQVLKNAGYATGITGKWHLGAHPIFHPNQRGFDEFFGFLGGGHRYILTKKTAAEYETGIQRNGKPVEEKSHVTDAIGREAADFIERHHESPWFLYVAFNAPHTPLQPAPQDLAPVAGIADEKRRKYAGLVVGMDRAIGRVLDTLRESGKEKGTLVFFFSDNGGPERANGSDNGPLRGEKGDLFEGGIRVPFLVSWPGRLTPGVFDRPITSTDVFATAALLAGAQAPVNLDSVDVLPFLAGSKDGSPHERVFWRVGGSKGRIAVREGDWKWMRADGKAQLFDLKNDIGETRDLSGQESARAAALEKTALAWSAEMIEPRWPGLGGGKKPAVKKAK